MTATAWFPRVWTDHKPVIALAVLSLVFEAAWFSVQNVGFHCDSPAYVEFAWGLFGYPIPPLILWVRTVGYPLLLALGGVVGPNATFHSFLGILLIQGAMAVAMPVLVFKTLEFYNRRIAFITALVTIASLQPYIGSKLVMTEQSFKFFSVLLVYLTIKTYQSRSPRWWVAALSAVCVFLTLLRPAALLMAVIVFGALLLARRAQWKPLVGGFLAFGASMFVHSFAVCLLIPPLGLYKPEKLSKFANLAFYDLYMYDNAAGLGAEKGGRRGELRKVVEAFAHTLKPGWIGRRPVQYFAPYADAPARWVDSLYTDPNRFKFMAFKDAVLIYADQGDNPTLKREARKAIQRATFEAYRAEPLRLIKFLLRYGLAMPGGVFAEVLFNQVFSDFRLAKFSPDNGPASRELVEAVRIYFTDNPTEVRRLVPPPTFRDYTNDIDGLITEQLIGYPHGELFFNVWTILANEVKDPLAARNLYAAVVREGIERGSPHGRWVVYKGLVESGAYQLLRFYFNPFFNFDFFYSLVYCSRNTAFNVPIYEAELLSGMRLFPWVKIQVDRPLVFTKLAFDYADRGLQLVNASSWFEVIVQSLWMAVHMTCNCFIFLAAPFCMRSRCRWPILVVGALILLHAIPSGFVYAQDRYVDQIMPITILLAGLVAVAIVDRWSDRPTG